MVVGTVVVVLARVVVLVVVVAMVVVAVAHACIHPSINIGKEIVYVLRICLLMSEQKYEMV